MLCQNQRGKNPVGVQIMGVKQGLHRKVFLTITAVGILPLALGLIWIIFFGREMLIKASGDKFNELAKQISAQINFIIDREIQEAQGLALSNEIFTVVVLSNRMDSEIPDQPVPSDHPILLTTASRHLKNYQDLKKHEYEVIFVTDRAGKVVASTRPLPQRYYTHETWWQVAFAGGEGAISVTDLYRRRDRGVVQMELALPIMDQVSNRAVGTIKFIFKKLELDDIFDSLLVGLTGHAMLVDEGGTVLACSLRLPEAHQPIPVLHGMDGGWARQMNGHSTEETVVAFAPVQMITELADQNLILKSWWVVVTQDRLEIFGPIHKAELAVGGLGLGLIGFLVILGTISGRKLTRPVLDIQRGTEILAQGNLNHRLRVQTHDEVEALADTINNMAQKLQHRTSDLVTARDYLKNVIEVSPALIITTNRQYEIREFNREAEKILGYKRDEISGRDLEKMWVSPRDFQDLMAKVESMGQYIKDETTLARRDGSSVPVSCSLARLTDSEGQTEGLVFVGEDLTERKLLAESKIQADRMAALHRISMVLTHDLRSPMVGILKAMTLLMETHNTMPPKQVRDLLSSLLQGGDLLLGTFNDLLDVYRYNLEAIPLRLTRFPLGEVIGETVRLLEIDALARGIRIESRQAVPDLILYADRRRIQRVLFNLLENAIRYSPTGKRVGLQVLTPDPEHLHIEVEDEGPGIPSHAMDRVFEFLYEGSDRPTTGTDRGGTGIGLYYCRVALEAHGGRIWAHNRPEGGACLTARLPLRARGSNFHDTGS